MCLLFSLAPPSFFQTSSFPLIAPTTTSLVVVLAVVLAGGGSDDRGGDGVYVYV